MSPAWQSPSPLIIEKDLKPTVSSYGMDEAESQKDAALSLSDGGPLRRVRDPGGLESEGLTLRNGSILRRRSPNTSDTSQISDTQASFESSSTATVQSQTILSLSESESAITYPVSAAAADLSHATNSNTTYRENSINDHAIYSAKYKMSLLTANKLKLPK